MIGYVRKAADYPVSLGESMRRDKMIKIAIQLTADTNDHVLEICEDLCRHITKGSLFVDAHYTWLDSSLNLVRREVLDENIPNTDTAS